MPPATPQFGAPKPPAEAPKPDKKPKAIPGWDAIKGRANTAASIAALFIFLVGLGVAGGYFYSQSRKPAPVAKAPSVQTLSQSDIDKLSEVGANLGTSGQTLNIGANALFRGKAEVTGDLTIGGRLNANGPVTLSQLNITGTTAATGLNVGSNLIVSGTTTLQKAVSIQDLLTINGNLNVTGAASLNALNAKSISVQTIAISGPLTISHLATAGPTPFFAAGAVGAGGTVSISGNDTAGIININTGTGPGIDAVLMTITFRAAFGAAPHVLLTPRTSAAAQAQAFVSPTNTAFRVQAHNPLPGAVLSFDYFVTQ
jgi:hypothetical protein